MPHTFWRRLLHWSLPLTMRSLVLAGATGLLLLGCAKLGPPGPHVVKVRQDAKTGGWQLLCDGKPMLIKCVSYGATKVGQSPADGSQTDWMKDDFNRNGKPDGPFDAWVDVNRNNKQDADERTLGDFQLLKEMGCNSIRLYHHASDKALLRRLYNDYGIMVLMGDFVGMYGFRGKEGPIEGDNFTDYRDPKRRELIKKGVIELVKEHKDEPYILMWVLGNENNYNVACNASVYPDVYYPFINELAREIKKLDPNHPVMLCSGEQDIKSMKLIAKACPDVDVYGVNSYRGDKGFSNLWEMIRRYIGKAAMITEYGAPGWSEKGIEHGERTQARYLAECWHDIVRNADGGSGENNAIGGVLFEWMDEWWKTGLDVGTDGKTYSKDVHDTARVGSGPFADGWGYSEYFGIIGQGDGRHSPFQRELRRAYFVYRRLWNEQFGKMKFSVPEPPGIDQDAMGYVTRRTPLFVLAYPGDPIVDYAKYGIFHGAGTAQYYYEITDKDGLMRAVGEGIFPNEEGILKDPSFIMYTNAGKLNGSPWNFINTPDPQADFYKWATTAAAPAEKLFYGAGALEKAGLYQHAVKMLYAIVVHYPGAGMFNAEQTMVWYVGPVALDGIKDICRRHPELDLKLEGAEIRIDSKGDKEFSNDVVVVNPGRFVRPSQRK